MAFGTAPFGLRSFAQLSGSDPAARMSAFNFCDPFDHILPLADGTVSALDRQHLWGMYIGIAAGPPVVIEGGVGWVIKRRRRRSAH